MLREVTLPWHVLIRALQDNRTGWMYGHAFSAIALNVGCVAYWILLQPNPTWMLQHMPFVAAWLQLAPTGMFSVERASKRETQKRW